MYISVNEERLKMVLDKLDAVRLEMLRLRAQLLPEEEPIEEEEKEIEGARKEIAETKKGTSSTYDRCCTFPSMNLYTTS